MKGTTKLLAGSVLAAGMLAAAAVPAAAQGLGGLKWYGKALGGASWATSDDTTIEGAGLADPDIELEYDTGYLLGAAFGAYFTPNLSMELEYAYRSADLDLDEISGDVNSNSFMLNGIYWFSPMGANGAWQPFVGAGLGWANIDESTDEIGSFQRDNALAYQAIGGVAYNVTPAWTMTGEVRWYGTDSGRLDGDDGISFDTQYGSVDLLVGAIYRF
jgi:opacity protein-like surface antigen